MTRDDWGLRMMKVYQPVRLYQVLPSAIGILILGIALSYAIDFGWTPFGRLGWAALPLGIVAGLALYGLAYFFSCQGWFYTKPMRELMRSLHGLFSEFSWPAIVLISILAGVGEELLIRGVLQSWLVATLNPFWGIALASLAFGLMHYLAKVYVLVTFALGVLFGLLFYFSESLVLVMLAHTVYDVCAFAVIVKYPHLLGLGSKT